MAFRGRSEGSQGSGDREQHAQMARAIEELLEAGESDPAACERLEALIRGDDHALRQYLVLIDLDSRLHWSFRGGMGRVHAISEELEGQKLGADDSTHVASTDLKQTVPTHGPLSSRWTAPAGSVWQWARHRPAVAFGVCVALAATLLISVSVFIAVGRNGIGTLVQSASAQWAEPYSTLLPGQTVRVGEMSLMAGIAEIKLPGDTRMIIEGPATFNIQSRNLVYLKSGVVSVFVGHSVVGFTLATPDARIVDLGTAFQIRVFDRGTEVHVIQGKVMATAVRTDDHGANANELELFAREAVRFSRRDGSVAPIKFVGEQLKLLGSNVALSALPLAVTGNIRCLDHPPESVAVGEFEHDDAMFLFLEKNDFVLTRTLYADRNAKGDVASKSGNINMRLPVGARVNSYLLHYDPTNQLKDGELHRVSGTITFRSPIAGVFLTEAGLYESDKELSNPHTRYTRSKKFANRCLDAGDFVTFSPDRRTIVVNLQASTSADQVRIVTMKELP